MLTWREAHDEAERRFGKGTSRYNDFIAGWRGLARNGKYGREKYRNTYGKGRRSRNIK